MDVEFENALLKRAKGYEYLEEKVEIEELQGIIIKSHKVAPDVRAAAFWLKNRHPDVWRDKSPESTGYIDTKDDAITVAIKEDFK